MEPAIVLEMAKNVIGGLGIFLLGMRWMSGGMQAIAGPRLNRLISAVTDNRMLAVLSGVGVTCVVQSSSATTVMVVGFVNSGLMTLTQAIGVIFGANIGTTISAWLLTLDLSKFGPLLLGLATLPYLFAKRERTRNVGMAVLGIGMLFTGLEMMSNGFKPLRDAPAIMEWFQTFRADTYWGVIKCALVGCVVTLIVQSSTATIGITIGLAQTGVIGFDSAVALVLGENIGTTITAFLSSLGASRNGRRAAYAHILFNAVGAFWVTLVFHWFFLRLVQGVTLGVADLLHLPAQLDPGAPAGGFPQPRLGIAIAHSLFNVTNTLAMLPLMGLFARLVTWMVPVKPSEQILAPGGYKPLFLDPLMLESPMLAIEQSHKETVAMGEASQRMLEWLLPLLREDERDEELETRIRVTEVELDEAQHAVVDFVSRLIPHNVSESFSTEARRQLRRADEFESLSDAIRTAMKARNKVLESGERFSAEARSEMLALHSDMTRFTTMVVELVRTRDATRTAEVKALNAQIAKAIKDYRLRHLNRLASEQITAAKSVLYSDILAAFRNMKDHLLNLHDTLVE